MTKVDHYNLLLVEDEYLLRESLAHSIEELDDTYVVKAQAGNGEEAMEILQKEPIHAVFTDIQMPVMSGLDLARKMHIQYPDIPCIILTGYSDFEYAQEALRQQVFDYILKPISEDSLISVLSKLSLSLEKLYELPEDIAAMSRDAKGHVDYCISYIQEHYMEDIDLGSLASELGFSSAYLTKIFKKHAGMTPLKMLTDIRIHQAKRLLLETDMSIQEVGASVGYPDQFHFSKTFRKIVGINPTGYRNGAGTSAPES